MRFRRAYCAMSMCAPFRAELYTGLYPVRNGVAWNHSIARAGTKSVCHYLRELGYRVGLVGKKHASPADVFPFDNVKGPNPSGGLVSCAADLARFYLMVLNDGVWEGTRIVSADSVRQMTSPQTGELKTGFTPGNCWGLGWCIVRQPEGVTGMLSPGTFGHGGAFGTQGWVDPTTRTVFVLMIQRTKFGNSDGADIRKYFQQAVVDALAS